MYKIIFTVAVLAGLISACSNRDAEHVSLGMPVTALKDVTGKYSWARQQCGDGQVMTVLPHAQEKMQIEIEDDKIIHTLNRGECKIITTKAITKIEDNRYKSVETDRKCDGNCSDAEKTECGQKAGLETVEIELLSDKKSITEVWLSRVGDLICDAAKQSAPLKITYQKK